MAATRTTRCCSAVALVASLTAAAAAKVDRTPPQLFPVQKVWTLALNNQFTLAPTFDDTRAYFSIEGDRIVCYDTASGTQRWLVDARPQMEPVAGGDRLYYIEPGLITARNAADGSISWQLPFAETLAVQLVWDNGWLVAATSGGSILAYRATDGSQIWRQDLTSPAHARPALAADRVYIPVEDGRIVALRVDSGKPLWERRLGGRPNDILALQDRLYVGSLDNFLYCLMATDGRIDWRWRTGGDVKGLPAFDDDHVYFVSLDNVLRSLDRISGAQKWMRGLPFRPAWAPVRVGGTIVVAGQSATLRAYKTVDGMSAGDKAAGPAGSEMPAGGEIAAAPHVVASASMPTLVVVTRDIAKGAAAVLVTRSFEPLITPVAPLPNPGLAAPAPTPTIPR